MEQKAVGGQGVNQKKKKPKTQHAPSEVRISCFCSTAHSASEESRAMLEFNL